jgi:hypothetical protein
MVPRHRRDAGGAHQIIVDLQDESIFCVVDAELVEPLGEMAAHLELATPHPRQHRRNAGFHTISAARMRRVARQHVEPFGAAEIRQRLARSVLSRGAVTWPRCGHPRRAHLHMCGVLG